MRHLFVLELYKQKGLLITGLDELKGLFLSWQAAYRCYTLSN